MKKTWLFLTILFTVALGGQGALAQSFRLGDEAEEIAIMQQALEDLELYYADITGHYGERTERAVKLFQKRNDLPETGVADEVTILALNAAAGVNIPLQSAQEEAPQMSVLRNGMSGEAVRKLQEDLTTLGFYTGSITGHFGDLTQEAVRLFQRAQDISSDGIAGPQTLGRIEEAMQTLRQPVVTPTTPPQAVVPSAPSASSTPVSLLSVEMISVGQTLRYGDYSEQVRRLQRALCALGYMNAAQSGYYDVLTEAAVMAYQNARGLEADGVAGYWTITSINGDVLDGISQLLGTDD